MKNGLHKIYLSILLIIFPVVGAWSIPENYYYMKDNSKTVYFPKTADRAFSLTESGQPINISNNTIYGYYSTDIRITCPVYDQMYYTRTGQGTIYISWDKDSFETNLNLVDSKNKQISYENVISALVAGMLFLQLISFNQFRVRKAREKAI